MTAVQDHARALYKELEPISRRFFFEAPPAVSEINAMPMVLFLGNHSSGKSSFINHLLGERIQRTGIAPVDDGFTILVRGPESGDKDGAAVVTHPDLGWESLKKFGDRLVARLKLRTHQSDAMDNIALVDSPGMIDAGDTPTDRGYDFPRVVRWFAERADIIVFLFDPDKPGTTGETVRVLKQSLDGLDHKVLLVFNKVDRFGAMRDFARAYGALCWNLARALARKDLPHIYNTYLPVAVDAGGGTQSLPLDDFERARDEVADEVRRAPSRRLDNVVSRLYHYSRRLSIHATVLNQRHVERRRHLQLYIGVGLIVVVLAGIVGYSAIQFSSDAVGWLAGTLVFAALGLGGVYAAYRWTKHNSSHKELFAAAYAQALTLEDRAADLIALWSSVEEQVRLAMRAEDNLGSLSRAEAKRLDRIISVEVPELRRKVGEQKDQDDEQTEAGPDGLSR